MSSVLESKIDRVKLYHQGARVFRTLSAELPEAARELSPPTMTIEITGLPLAMQDETINLSLTSHRNEWAVSDIKVGLHVDARDNLPEAPDEQELREVQSKLTSLRAQHDLLHEERRMISHMEPPARPRGKPHMPPPASPLKARLAMEAFVHAAHEDRIAKARELLEHIAALEETEANLHDRIARASSARKVHGNEVSKVVIAQLTRRRGESTDIDLELSYMVPGARWTPQYTCHIERTGESADIHMRALVIQASGEDWKGVSLELSTADPVSWTELPKLSSLRIGKAQPAPSHKPGFRPPPQGAEALFHDHDAAYRHAYSLAPVQHVASPMHLAQSTLSGMIEGLSSWPEELHDALDDDLYDDIEEELDEYAPAMSAGAGMAMQEELEAAQLGSAAPKMMSRSASFGGAPPAPPAPAPRRVSRKKRAPVARMSSPAASLPERNPSFRALHLHSFDPSQGSARGSLTVASREARYLEIFHRSKLDAAFTISTLLSEAHSRAMLATQVAVPSGTQDIAQSSGYFDYIYGTQNRVDVPSDTTYHSIPVDTRVANCNLRYVTVPRESQHVFREASVENPHRAPMLCGPAEIYVGGEYVLTTTLPTVAPRGKFRLGLGVEQAIKCARNTSYREERSGRAVVATAELHHEIRIELVNNLERAIQCEVRERIPQPDTEAEVVVEELNVEPAWQPYLQDERQQGNHVIQGGRSWSLEIEPGQQADLLAHYVIKIYANNEITGGNRRES